ncbi:hypothetical protein D0469_03390 [Peribacillus saganii]|uniref:Uncharacterized protein n=1 Tax=Peribacillus saganii TaxID=2303992 RepID=A0A372LS41_9BACI|nr:hypothetical protein D0469_03390 [Peribacillus saganii]
MISALIIYCSVKLTIYFIYVPKFRIPYVYKSQANEEIPLLAQAFLMILVYRCKHFAELTKIYGKFFIVKNSPLFTCRNRPHTLKPE